MQRIAFLLFCLACVGLGRRVQRSLDKLDREPQDSNNVAEEKKIPIVGEFAEVPEDTSTSDSNNVAEEKKRAIVEGVVEVTEDTSISKAWVIGTIVFGILAVALGAKLMCKCFCPSVRKLAGPQTLKVKIVKATNLESLNVLGDAPYCKVMVVKKGTSEMVTSTASHLVSTKSTKAMKGNLSPEWNEEFLLTAWTEGDDLIFDILDEGKMGYGKREARCTLATDQFYPFPFDGSLTIDAGKSRSLNVKVEHVGPTSTAPSVASSSTPVLAPLEKRDDRGKVVLVSTVFSMYAGMVNTYGFYQVGVLLSHQTGNACHLGRQLEEELVKQLANSFFSFGVGCAVAAFAKFDAEHYLATNRSLGLTIAGFCVLLATVIQWQLENMTTISVALLAFSQGMQNAITSSCKAMPLRTTHITGSLTDGGMYVGNRARAYFEKASPPNPWKPSLLWLSMIFFTIGGVISQQLFYVLDAKTGLLPAVMMLVSAGGGLLGPIGACSSKRKPGESQQSKMEHPIAGA